MKPTRMFDPNQDGFYGAWYPTFVRTNKALILMLGDSSDDYMAKSGAKWVNKKGLNALCMSPDKKDYGHHSYPLERFGKAIEFLKSQGIEKIGIAGASTTGMLALIAASYYPEITLTIALSPSDFVMQGFYRDGKDGVEERPADNESSVTWKGEGLPYLPYAYKHPEYWYAIQTDSRGSHNFIASRKMFDESERRHPVKEEEKIKVERIHGTVICIGAEDDVLWDTCKYIQRMADRLKHMEHSCDFKAIMYTHGTHFVFPESLLKMMLPIGSTALIKFMFKAGREYPKQCKETRIDIDQELSKALMEW